MRHGRYRSEVAVWKEFVKQTAAMLMVLQLFIVGMALWGPPPVVSPWVVSASAWVCLPLLVLLFRYPWVVAARCGLSITNDGHLHLFRGNKRLALAPNDIHRVQISVPLATSGLYWFNPATSWWSMTIYLSEGSIETITLLLKHSSYGAARDVRQWCEAHGVSCEIG